jgi:hypothetical protein
MTIPLRILGTTNEGKAIQVLLPNGEDLCKLIPIKRITIEVTRDTCVAHIETPIREVDVSAVLQQVETVKGGE